ncbi:exopolygalacturonase-like [Rhodamnia argentea]|uniref:Exopolygalacturonase-like n=1 Tax=Rhodamnia argentea TaxID=178133 RepID=A0A8B8PXX3_9MYRT|nr:exopolygalacturonase-like [Rhodamnia argentea]
MGQRSVLPAAIALLFFASTATSQVYDVTKYGASGGGSSDISQALVSAWKEACASTNASKVKITVPAGTYVLREVVLGGPCKAAIEVQVDGTLKAPADPAQMKTDGWVTFQNVDQFTLSGHGTFDGQGKTAWTKNICSKTKECANLPINIRFNFVTNAIVQDITSLDSKQFHVNVLGCKNFTLQHVTITAPGNSPNTDGIHIGRSTGVNIIDTGIKTGDDCISIGDGSEQIHINGVTCGPGHGISVGSLGRYPGEQPVSGIFVKNSTITGTMNGVRIKTWPASPAGTAMDMHFEDITLDNVGNPILIDQKYCPWNQCTAQVPSLIKISNVSFRRIRGTSSTQVAVKLDCSPRYPCDKVEISDIDIAYHGAEGPATSLCTNVKPVISGKQNPAICANATGSSQAQ